MRTKSLVTVVSRSLVNHFKIYADSIIPDLREYQKDLLIHVRVVSRTDEECIWGVLSTTYNSLTQTIRVDIITPTKIEGIWLGEFIPEFKKKLRYEIERHMQHMRGLRNLETEMPMPLLKTEGAFSGKPEKGPWTTVGSAARYFLNPLEIEANVASLYREAKARRKKFYVVLKNNVEEICVELRDYGFDENRVGFLKRRIYQVWGFYALTRYPSLRRKKIRYFNVSKDSPVDE